MQSWVGLEMGGQLRDRHSRGWLVWQVLGWGKGIGQAIKSSNVGRKEGVAVGEDVVDGGIQRAGGYQVLPHSLDRHAGKHVAQLVHLVQVRVRRGRELLRVEVTVSH